MKTLLLNPTKAPFTNTITTQRAAEFNIMVRAGTTPMKAVALMFATLLDELHDKEVLDAAALGRILDMEVVGVETFNTSESPAS